MSKSTQNDDSIDSNDDMPDRDELVELRRDYGLDNSTIADEHFPQFTSRQIGLFASMYGISKGWKDEEYLREQIEEEGQTPEDLAEQWPVTPSTVRNWMDEFDIDENPIPEDYDDARDALEQLASDLREFADADDLADEYEEIAQQLNEDEASIFQ